MGGAARFATTSAADGAFTLTGFQAGAAFVFARKAGYRLAAVPVLPTNSDRVAVALRKATEPPAELPPVPDAHRKALDALTRYALTLVWDTHATFGYGGNALADMARIDPGTAKKWRDDERKRTGGKTDFTRRIDAAERQKTLFATARADIDEALAIVGGLKGTEGSAEALRVGQLMLPVDKPKALMLAEEAVVKARQCDLPERIWVLAQAGDLAARAGGSGGKKVVAEVAELAKQLAPDRGASTASPSGSRRPISRRTTGPRPCWAPSKTPATTTAISRRRRSASHVPTPTARRNCSIGSNRTAPRIPKRRGSGSRS